MDEAGTSATEPVTVVIGIIVDADNQLTLAEAAISECLDAVPKAFRQDFIFHATEIWGSEKYRPGWSMTDRIGFLKSVMRLPRRLGLPISMAIIRREMDVKEKIKGTVITEPMFHHMLAFANCLASADRYIRTYARIGEIATAIAEDVPEMRRFLKDAPTWYRDTFVHLPKEGLCPTEQDKENGYIDQNTDYRISRIRRSVHFVSKGDDPILQLADAVAFAFRRYFAKEDFGEDFQRAVLGFDLIRSDFDSLGSDKNFYPHPREI